ncbi:L-threonylcarbamoyladenylate synthase [Natranaeroarchaeum aerophilus]|uniref:L-threonylcarbamoyladenylate synthase n=1 Tax=Natranaeroarchaeum aerophilus TaxID=2917711 RepID=A0AAE3FSY1_9EURY|nr:L-threonylcarbamoyladenylate synthase [Natranaeroarchaeum aerophilus]MCL9814997.1 threonylcarbamoyl-AMP synthase [Natranaeroarchaeum aerophilus]
MAEGDSYEVLEPKPENIERAADCLQEGRLVVAPSDANMGLAVDPHDIDAIDRVYKVKQRDRSKPLTLMFHDPSDWTEYGSVPDADVMNGFVEAFWPGPLNIVVNRQDVFPDELVGGMETISLACYENPTWRAFVEHAEPIAMTSANISGEADGQLVDRGMAEEHVGEAVEYIIDGGPHETTQSTTIIDLSDTSDPSVLRQGDISVSQLNDVRDCF